MSLFFWPIRLNFGGTELKFCVCSKFPYPYSVINHKFKNSHLKDKNFLFNLLIKFIWALLVMLNESMNFIRSLLNRGKFYF